MPHRQSGIIEHLRVTKRTAALTAKQAITGKRDTRSSKQRTAKHAPRKVLRTKAVGRPASREAITKSSNASVQQGTKIVESPLLQLPGVDDRIINTAGPFSLPFSQKEIESIREQAVYFAPPLPRYTERWRCCDAGGRQKELPAAVGGVDEDPAACVCVARAASKRHPDCGLLCDMNCLNRCVTM